MPQALVQGPAGHHDEAQLEEADADRARGLAAGPRRVTERSHRQPPSPNLCSTQGLIHSSSPTNDVAYPVGQRGWPAVLCLRSCLPLFVVYAWSFRIPLPDRRRGAVFILWLWQHFVLTPVAVVRAPIQESRALTCLPVVDWNSR